MMFSSSQVYDQDKFYFKLYTINASSDSVSEDYNKERNPYHLYYRRDSESEISETAEKGKEYDGERGPLNRPEGHCQGSCEEGGEGSHEGAEKEVKEMMSH